MKNEEKEIEINLYELFAIFKDKVIWIVAFALLGAVIAYTYSSFFITPLYSASAVMYVNSKAPNAYAESISETDVTASSELVPTYKAIVSTKAAMKRAITEGGIVGYTPEQLLSMISTQSVQDTGLLQITVTGENQYDVADIANAVAQSGTKEITAYIDAATVSIIDYAITPERSSSPNKKRNALIGFLAGAIIYMIVVAFLNQFDTSLKKSDDFANVLNAPVLGVIPDAPISPASDKPSNKSDKSGGKH